MNIDHIRLRQFKLFGHLDINPRRLTLLTGMNSTGKSSVMNALSAVCQTEQPHYFPFELVPNGKNCSLGSYRDIVNGRNTKKSFSVGFCVNHQNVHVSIDATYRYSSRGDHILPKAVSFKADSDTLELRWLGHQQGYQYRAEIPSVNKALREPSTKAVQEALVKFAEATLDALPKAQQPKKKMDFIKELFAAPERRTEWTRLGRSSPRDLADKIAALPTGSFTLRNLHGFMREFRKYVGYVGPIRALPQRYYLPDQPQAVVDPQGLYTPHLLYDWNKHDKARFREVAKSLHDLELLNILRARSDSDEILKMMVQPYEHRETANLADVGFGVSQALPFVVADVALPSDSVLMINQPEVHLHPTSQAKLANYFVSRLEHRQYIIETHSEYLINRLRLLVQKGEVNPDNVLIIFFATNPRKPSSVKASPIELTEDGALKGAPKEFFKTYYKDSFALAIGGK